MVAAAMESRRLGLCSKSMVVVPNHIIEQFAAEWLQLYPVANLLVSTKKDFETRNRKKFCARIAASDVDAVIIGHVPHVLRYYVFGRIPTGIGNQAIVQVALTQEGNSGDTYWRWYGFNARVEWCACFVSWCADQYGYIVLYRVSIKNSTKQKG